MPGLVGLISSMPRYEAQQQLACMMDVMKHEPFYVWGTQLDESMAVYVGWTVRKGSFWDASLRDDSGRVCLYFCGEDFSTSGAPALRSHDLTSVSDSAPCYLLESYEQDTTFPAGLNGRFHGLVVDQRRRQTILFNDRFGLQRMYYHDGAGAFYFGAEAKAILAVCPELRRIRERSLAEVISCGCVLENRSLFEGIDVLPPGSAWTFEEGRLVRRRTYFDPAEWENQATLSSEEYYKELRKVFAQNLPRYFAGSEPIAMSLTGGLDTRMIMAWQKSRPGSLPCYSFGGMYRDCQDVVIGRRVAQECNQSHQVIPVGREFLSKFCHYATRSVYLTDGCIDVSHSPDLYVNERAAAIAPVRMTGNYGGEILRQVRAFKPQAPIPGLFSGDISGDVEDVSSTYMRAIKMHPVSFAAFRQAPWHHYGLLALEQTQVSVRSPFLDNDFVRTVYRAPRAQGQDSDVSLRLIADGSQRLAHIPTDRGVMADDDGVRRRAIQALIEFSVKAEYAYDYGMPQWVAAVDHRLSRFHIERLFLGRHKFYHFRYWYRSDLAAIVREILLDARSLSRPYLERKRVEQIVGEHTGGKRNFTLSIHKLLTLELVHRMFVDRP